LFDQMDAGHLAEGLAKYDVVERVKGGERMLVSPFARPTPSLVQVDAALEPVRNRLLSLWALTANETEDGAWPEPLAVTPELAQLAAQLPPAQQQFNRLLFAVFGAALAPEEAYPDFDSYLSALAAQPNLLRPDQLVAAAQHAPSQLQAESAHLLTDAPALQAKIIEHLRTVWDGLLAAEWQL
jgi:hypothetical protein